MKASDVVEVVKNIIPYGLAIPFQAKLTDDFVIAGGIELCEDDGETISVTNHLQFASSRTNTTQISEMHFVPPNYFQDCNKTIHGALATLLRSVRKRRYAQLDKSQRRVSMAGCYGELFHMLAEKEHGLGVMITVEGDRLKAWFNTVNELQSALGEVEFSSRYSAGTPFTLQPPFGILWNPSKDTCWIRCAPEQVELPSHQPYCADADCNPEGYVELPAEDFDVLNKI
jgi:hypothetical protein